MTLRSLIVVAALAVAPVAVRAQTGLYLNPIAIRASNSIADKGTFAFLGQNQTSQMFWGVNFGGYYDFQNPRPIKFGIDIRDSILHGSGASLNNFLVGIRVSGRPFNNPLKPYLEPVFGDGHTRAPFTAITIGKPEYGVYAGVDYTTKHHIDFRLIEVGYLSLVTASSETIGGTTTIPSATLLNVSTGLVFRFP